MHSVTTRRLTTVAVAGATALAVLAPAASADDAVAKLPAKLTVKSYTAYLKAQKTPEAKRTLRSFSALPAAKQSRFVGHLQNGKIYSSLFRQLKGNLNRPLKTVTPYNKDVSFVHEVAPRKTKGAVSVAYTATETIFGIPVTSERLTLHYKIAGGKVQRGARAVAQVTNVNAAVAIKGGAVKVAVKGIARADVTWKATPKVQSVGKSVRKDQAVSGHLNTWTASITHG